MFVLIDVLFCLYGAFNRTFLVEDEQEADFATLMLMFGVVFRDNFLTDEVKPFLNAFRTFD